MNALRCIMLPLMLNKLLWIKRWEIMPTIKKSKLNLIVDINLIFIFISNW